MDPSVFNPVAALPCAKGGGDRTRSIGTGNLLGFVRGTTDSIGYTFFSYGASSGIAGSTPYGYLKLDGVDPLGLGTPNQQLPTCANPCPLAPNTSFLTLRKGGYQAWAIYRVVTDATGPNNTYAAALVAAAQKNVNSTVPDFVPFNAQADGDLGLQVFRSHYTQSGVAPHNGINVSPESGGDMGGCIELKADELAFAPSEILSCQQ